MYSFHKKATVPAGSAPAHPDTENGGVIALPQAEEGDPMMMTGSNNNPQQLPEDYEQGEGFDDPTGGNHGEDAAAGGAGREMAPTFRSRRAEMIMASYQPPAADATEEVVLKYFRDLIQKHTVTPPKNWREIRFDLPASVAELRLDPPTPETVQYQEPVTPSPCIVILLEGMLPEGMTIKEYSVQMVNYIFELMQYQNAVTAITTLRFVKKGTELSQLVLTFGRDIRLATRMLEQLQQANMVAGYGQPILDYPPNATFEINDFRFVMNEGKGISSEQINQLLDPFRQSGTGDINVIPGYEPGVFFAPVKRPETVYSFLWNHFCSSIFQRELFQRYGILITMALCPHEFLQKGVPYSVQKKQMEMERARMLRQKQLGETAADNKMQYGTGAEDELLNSDDDMNMDGHLEEPEWAMNAVDEVDIFGDDSAAPTAASAPSSQANPQTKAIAALQKKPPTGSTTTGLTFVDDDVDAEAEDLLKAFNAEHRDPPPPPAEGEDAYAQMMQQGGGHNGGDHGYYGGPGGEEYYQHPPPQPYGGRYPPPPQHGGPPPHPYGGGPEHFHHPPPAEGSYYPGAPPPHHPHHQAPRYNSKYGPAPAFPQFVEDEDDDQEATNTTGRGAPIGGGWQQKNVEPALAHAPHNAEDNNMNYNEQNLSWNMMGSTSGSYSAWQPHQQQEEQRSHPGAVLNAPRPQGGGILSVPHDAAIVGEGLLSHGAHHHQRAGWQASMPIEEANRLASIVEDHVRNAFPHSSPMDLAVHPPFSSLDAPVMQCVSPNVRLPRQSTEIDELTDMLEAELNAIKQLLDSNDVNVATQRRRVAAALMTALPLDKHEGDWTPIAPNDGNASQGDLPALVPYLLASHEGTALAALLAKHFPEFFAPLLARYCLPYLLDIHVIQGVCCASFRSDPSAGNALVKRILRHWVSLTEWLYDFIDATAEVEARQELQQQQQQQSNTTVSDADSEQKALRALQSTVAKRLISNVGNTMDHLLAGMSMEQRQACTQWSRDNGAIPSFIAMLEDKHAARQKQQAQSQDGKDCILSELWGIYGAVRRTLLRLYLNADIVCGAGLSKVLFEKEAADSAAGSMARLEAVSRDAFYFLIVSLSKSQVSPSLSVETAALCGCFLRLMEIAAATNSSSDALGEKEALQLLDTAFRSLRTPEAYVALRSAYYETNGSANDGPPRFEKVTAKLQSTTAPLPPKKPSSASPPVAGILDAKSAWLPEWTAAMRTYPASGDPFTPLPTGWTSSLSRSYGHYYFKPPPSSGGPTYKHPSDATEFMVSPQALLTEKGCTTTLEEIRKTANEKLSKGGMPAITQAEAEAWLRDQRTRNLYLDLAVLEVLRVVYRVGGRSQQKLSSSSDIAKRPRNQEDDDATPAQRLGSLRGYPAKGIPFPELFRGWSLNMTTTSGIYTFRTPRGEVIFKHPGTQRMYRVPPQAFAQHHGISAADVAKEANVAEVEVAEWMTDQRYRSPVIDNAAVRMMNIRYTYYPELDDRSTSGRDSRPPRRTE